ncbi:MAG: hypothetical protein EZS28_009509 [Streblomastix strix]|uniref:Uncharacterized protein n=1 Tax=Streblomastix strix TaxID=222440 RepID=A0A5J4WJ51_9EUKA|nr:MAG: hypothetical protein EZS28_009509 [Streblomastix strix]
MSLPAYIVEQQLEHQRKLVLPEEYSLIVTPSDKSLSQLQKDFIQQILFQNLIVEDIKSIFECKDCQTEGDIVEFQNNFTLKLINSSHHPSIKLSYKSTVNNHPLLHQLLPHVFAAMWDCLFQKNANKELDNITLQLEKLLSKENLPSEVGINILNLDEFMERRETPIPFNLDLLSRIAIKCQMIPAALRYKEMETVSKIRLDINTQFPVWHSLISTRVGDQNCTADQIYFLDDDDDKQQDDEYSLREDDACIGIVQFGEEMFQQQVDAWKHEKMRNWDEAEKLYRQKLDKDTFSQQSFQEQRLINPNETASPQWQKNILGLVRCLMQLGEQEEVLRIALIYSNAQTGEAKRKLAVYGAQAALHLHEFDKLKDLIELMDVEQPEIRYALVN